MAAASTAAMFPMSHKVCTHNDAQCFQANSKSVKTCAYLSQCHRISETTLTASVISGELHSKSLWHTSSNEVSNRVDICVIGQNRHHRKHASNAHADLV